MRRWTAHAVCDFFEPARSKMAVTKLPHKIQRLAGIGVTTPDAAALCPFYERALGFWMRTAHWNARELAPALRASGIAGRISLGLGSEIIELQQFDRPGRPYPLGAAASDLCFQHFAIVVADMTTAYQRLCSVGGWSAISTEGPQRLTPSSAIRSTMLRCSPSLESRVGHTVPSRSILPPIYCAAAPPRAGRSTIRPPLNREISGSHPPVTP